MCPLKTSYWKESRRRFLEEQREEERKLREKKREVQRKYDIYQRSVDRCIAEGRDFTPLSIIWYEHWLDGFEGDVVFPAVEELPFDDDNVLSDDDVCDDDSSLLLIYEFPITKEEQIDIVVEMEDANDTVFVSEVVKNEALVVDEIVNVEEASVEAPVESSEEHTEVLDAPAEVFDLSLQVQDDLPYEVETSHLDTSKAALVVPLVDLSQVVLGRKPAHHFFDPFAACVDAAPILHCSSYIAATPCFVHSFVRPLFCSSVSLLQHMASFSHQVDLRFSLRRIFDPGIALMFLVGCSGLISDADFYDVLLIRGRILSNREGMM